MEAAAIVAAMTDDEEVIAAAVLHDTVEDTAVTLDEICKQFGKRVAELVAAESANKREDKPAASTWKIRKEETIEHLKTAPKEVKMLTLGDKLSNIRSICRDYEAQGDALWQRFNQKDKNEHRWYYKSIADCLSGLCEYPRLQGICVPCGKNLRRITAEGRRAVCNTFFEVEDYVRQQYKYIYMRIRMRKPA